MTGWCGYEILRGRKRSKKRGSGRVGYGSFRGGERVVVAVVMVVVVTLG